MEEKEPDELDAYAIRLALNYASWVNRRVERFDFIDATSVRRHMSIDFIPPEGPFEEGETVLVPLMMLRRGMLRGLDVTDADGRSLSVVESAAGNAVTLAGIRALFGQIAGVKATEIPTEDLAPIFGDNPKVAQKKARSALNSKGAIGRMLQKSTFPEDLPRNEAKKVRRAVVGTLTALINELTGGFLLLVAVPYRPGVPMLIKVSYDAWIESSVRQLRRDGNGGTARRLLVNRLFSSLGLVGRLEYFTGLEVRRAKSYHAEIVPAPGTYCEEANLGLRRAERGKPVKDPPTRGVYRDFHPSRPHLWIGDGGQRTNRDEQGVVEVALFAARDGLILPLLISAALIAGVLVLVPARHPDVDGITLGALLLAPVALAAFYARSDENGYLTKAMRGLRGVTLVSVVAAITTVALISLGYVEVPDGNGRTRTLGKPVALEVMHWSARVALACAVLLAMAWCAPAVNARIRRRRLGHDTDLLRVGERAGEPEPSTTLIPAMVLFACGALLMVLLVLLLEP